MTPRNEIPVERVTPYATDESKRVQIARAFDALARRYDPLNRVLSLGLDTGWRRRALSLLREAPPARLLDAATGTADFALLAARLFPAARITGIDVSEGMLEKARRKVSAAGLSGRIALRAGDALALPFPEASFDAVTAAFGVRNFEDIAAGFSEMRRVLVPGGRAVILELSEPETFPCASSTISISATGSRSSADADGTHARIRLPPRVHRTGAAGRSHAGAARERGVFRLPLHPLYLRCLHCYTGIKASRARRSETESASASTAASLLSPDQQPDRLRC
jgi:ubiquinone/menaquinone biosynthesis methyltransferase